MDKNASIAGMPRKDRLTRQQNVSSETAFRGMQRLWVTSHSPSL